MYVYIFLSEKSSRYYVGQTTDIKERLKRHNSGRVNSPKYGIPWKVVLQIEVSNQSEAMLLENKIKKRGAKRFIDDHRGVVLRPVSIKTCSGQAQPGYRVPP